MHTRKFIIAGLLSTTSLSVLALIGAQQAQINNFKPFVVIVTVALILGAMAYYQKHLQHH
ncbi:hypothetical protein [bacterium endosymbiont of Bathymodiolus sp. 5 South]|jgi:uncharacterized membrane protein YdjX (TVP38/TMEM64 family)|uniref:hypothetical protein n=1 Tax=bacterium endosymbiont of Bathymodiolus sp. 5 South TaxID=1181670 RepID=UPI0002E8561A|nr:hypothetical protein [bacterium endosymbiont of Bathymodiolus sp. 5 South]CAC9477156.1 hypothetical protein [uncultured Gammaproteobacteria bacterium]CAC9634533.1 hypothetical protein [uncultured Gammaproteobacteria bacterium]CAC9636974.1 hypothetical protein [uncultured Gammaproteobacteria bacterium]CAC9644457.1 hypothetical protein [uncultured Gammaproteobacteria bacterium]SHN90126.1 hypothetical protein BCLUESOX_164 [bacterium endosymbiont of Bathymodiolus sp. 5 South]